MTKHLLPFHFCVLSVGAVIALTTPAVARELCAPSLSVIAHKLLTEYSEVPLSWGLTDAGGVVTLFRSATTWTMVYTRPDRVACIAGTGHSWEHRPDVIVRAAPSLEAGNDLPRPFPDGSFEDYE